MFELLNDLYEDLLSDNMNYGFMRYDVNNCFMATDISEDEKGYYFEIEMPGVIKENVKIEYDNNKLIVKVNDKIREYLVKGVDFSNEQINAKLENGILYIFLPKEVKVKKNINIL